MNDEKKVKATQEEAKTEEKGVELTDEELAQVTGGGEKQTHINVSVVMAEADGTCY